MSDLWTWRETVYVVTPGSAATNAINSMDVTGFEVEASDGHIGKVDEATYEVGGSYLVVDTGFWIFGKKRMIPASVAERVDQDQRKIVLRMTKDEVKEAPDYDPDRLFNDQRSGLDDYYGAAPARGRRR
jgi:hypothetical protein